MSIAIQRITAQKYAVLSIALSLLELMIVWTAVGVALAYPRHDWSWLGTLIQLTVGVGLGSVMLAVIGLFRHPEWALAAFALLFGLITCVICGIPLAV